MHYPRAQNPDQFILPYMSYPSTSPLIFLLNLLAILFPLHAPRQLCRELEVARSDIEEQRKTFLSNIAILNDKVKPMPSRCVI